MTSERCKHGVHGEDCFECFPKAEKQKPYVKLTGSNGNAFSVIGKCVQALEGAGYTKGEIDKFKKEAMSGNYDNVLITAMKWCDVD